MDGPSSVLESLPLLPTVGEVGILRRLTKSPIIVDVQGRPLCEGHARTAPDARWWYGNEEPARSSAPFEYTRCPYHDARRNHPNPMNASALSAVAGCWDEVIALSSWLAREHERTFAEAGELEDGVALYHRVASLFAAPLCAFLRNPGLRLDPVIGSAWKAGLGFLPVVQQLLVDGLHAEPRPITGADVYAAAQRTGALIGRREVCAGTPRMIVSAADALLGRISVPEAALERARASAEALGEPGEWLPATAVVADHWLVDKAVLLVASMLQEDWAARHEVSTSPRRFPRDAESRRLLLEGVARVSIELPEVQPVWEALADLLPQEPNAEPRAAIDALAVVQREALSRMEAGLRERLSLSPLPMAIGDSLCFVDLGGATVQRDERIRASERLTHIVGAMQLEARVAEHVLDLSRALSAGAPTQPARVTARLLAAQVRFAREVARIEGLPVQTEAVERLAADASTALRDVAGSIRFGPTRALLLDLADTLDAERPNERSLGMRRPGSPRSSASSSARACGCWWWATPPPSMTGYGRTSPRTPRRASSGWRTGRCLPCHRRRPPTTSRWWPAPATGTRWSSAAAWGGGVYAPTESSSS